MSMEGSNRDSKIEAVTTAVSITKAALDEFLDLVNSVGFDEHTIRGCDTFLRLSCDYVNAIESLSSNFTVHIDWIPSNLLSLPGSKETSDKDMLLRYAEGDSPWSFWLTFEHSDQFKCILEALEKEYNNGHLIKLDVPPEAGSFVACLDRNHVFRAVVLGNNGIMIRVRNVDSPSVNIVKLEQLYYLPRKFCSVHAQTVHCTLLQEDSLKHLWNSYLSDLFKGFINQVNLKVKFIDLYPDCITPKYLVDMKSSGDLNIDFNNWICHRMLPELVKYKDNFNKLNLDSLPVEVLDPFFEEDDLKKKKVHFSDKNLITLKANDNANHQIQKDWSPQLFIPPNPVLPYLPQASQFGFMAPPGAAIAQYTTTTVYTNHHLNDNRNFSISQQLVPQQSNHFVVKGNDFSKSALNVNTPIFEPRKSIELSKEINSENKNVKTNARQSIVTSKPKTNIPPVINECLTNLENICKNFNEKGFCLKSDCQREHIRINKLLPSNNAQSSSKPQPLVKASISKVSNATALPTTENFESSKVTKSLASHQDEESEEDMEEPTINGGYMPTDETRYCKFPAESNGTCWKKSCNKEHKDANTNEHKYTLDKLPVVISCFNDLDLPEEGETVELVVTSVKSAVLFYANLPNNYSEIGEGSENMETFATLHKEMNSTSSIRNYKKTEYESLMYCEGELCLVKSSVDQKWKRARIIDDFKKTAKVFYIDYGDEEIIPKSVIRVIENRFLHLPPQAVLCSLHGVYSDPNDETLRQRGKKALQSLIRGAVISGKVTERHDGDLTLIVTCNNINVNQYMISKGFCEELCLKDNAA